MSKVNLTPGVTSKILVCKAVKLSDGSDLTGVLFGDLIAYYCIEGATPVAITLATMTPGTWATGGWIERSSTHMPGQYELGIPNAALVAGTKSVTVSIQANGGTSAGMKTIDIEVQLDTSARVQYAIHKNTALAGFQFEMTLASDHISPYTGAANTITGYINIDGVKTAWSAGVAGSLAVVTGSPGDYTCNFAAADLNGNNIEFVFNATGCDTKKVFIATQS